MEHPSSPAPAPNYEGTSGKAKASLVLGLLSLLLVCFAGVPAIVLALMSMGDIRRSQGRLGGNGMALTGLITGILGSLATFALPLLILVVNALSTAGEKARELQSRNNPREIGIAFEHYDFRHDRWPAAGFGRSVKSDLPVPANPPRHLSWRVEILPGLDQQSLYDQFHHDEPWDSDHNKSLIALMPKIYKHPSLEIEEGKTVYLAVTGPNTVFPPAGPPTRSGSFSDGRSQTITVVEADADMAVTWTKPDDWEFDPSSPLRGLGHAWSYGFLVLFADGHVQMLRANIDPDAFAARCTPRGNELITDSDFD